MAGADKPNVVVTRWWWVRHAPVRNDGGNIYGQSDIACDTSDTYVFNAVAKVLPRKAVWYSSNLMRTHQTAEAIWAAGFPKPASMTWEADLAEQNLLDLGVGRTEMTALSRPALLAVEVEVLRMILTVLLGRHPVSPAVPAERLDLQRGAIVVGD